MNDKKDVSLFLYNMRDNDKLNEALLFHQAEMADAATRFEPIAKLLKDFSDDLKKRLGPNWEKIEATLREIDMMPDNFNHGDFYLRMNYDSGSLYMEERTPEDAKLKRLLESLS